MNRTTIEHESSAGNAISMTLPGDPQMRSLLLIAFATVAATVSPVWAKDRPVTDQERPMLASAVKAAGCSGGRMQFDADKRGQFEVHDTMCDGRKYELVFDRTFNLLKKKPS